MDVGPGLVGFFSLLPPELALQAGAAGFRTAAAQLWPAARLPRPVLLCQALVLRD